MLRLRGAKAIAVVAICLAGQARAASLPDGWAATSEDVWSLSESFGGELNLEFSRGYAANAADSPITPPVGVYVFTPQGELMTAEQSADAVSQIIRRRDRASRKAWTLGTGLSQIGELPENVYAYAFDRSHALFAEGVCFRMLMRVDAKQQVTDYCFVVFRPARFASWSRRYSRC